MVRRRVLSCLACLLIWVAPSSAAPILSISPSTQNVQVGDEFAVDVGFSGLDSEVRLFAFQIVLTFDPSIVQGVSYKYGSAWPDGAFEEVPPGGAFGTSGSFQVLSTAGVGAPSPDANGDLTLVTITFRALISGTTLIDFLFDSGDRTTLAYVVPKDPLSFSTVNGSVCVGECSTVPEPGSLALAAMGVAGLMLRRQRARVGG